MWKVFCMVGFINRSVRAQMREILSKFKQFCTVFKEVVRSVILVIFLALFFFLKIIFIDRLEFMVLPNRFIFSAS